MMNNKLCHCICGILLLGILTACTEKKEPVRQLKSEADLSGVILTTSAGTYSDQKYSGRDDLTLFRVNTEADAIQALRQGKADVFVTDEVALNKEAQERLNVSLAFLGEEYFDVACAVRKGNEVLLEQMNRFLAASKADGSLDAVISHWLHGTPAPEFPSQALESSTSALRCITATNLEPVCFLADGGEWQGKAGAYAIQGRGSLLVDSIEGDYASVVGLPLALLGHLLEGFGITLGQMWEV